MRRVSREADASLQLLLPPRQDRRDREGGLQGDPVMSRCRGAECCVVSVLKQEVSSSFDSFHAWASGCFRKTGPARHVRRGW